MKATLVYWEQNSKVMKAGVPYTVINKVIADSKLCGEWTEGKNEFGYWLCKIYVTPLSLIVVKEWVPSPGYSWDEVEIWWIET